MELGDQRASENVEDRRGIGVGGGIGIGGIVNAIGAALLGFDPGGTFQKLEAAQGRASKEQFNAISVRMELQADCYAGVWGYQAGKKKQLSAGDIEEALNAATAIGDDRLQKQSQGYVVPESFTHGSSAQRVRWFRRGIESGRPADCDTFSASSL